MKHFKSLLILSLILIVSFSCKKNRLPDYEYIIPELTDDGWEVSSADEAGLNSNNIAEMMDYINETPDHNIHSILIFKDDYLIFEEYFEGYLYSSNPPGSNGPFIQYDRLTDHFLASVSKSVTSVIAGAAGARWLYCGGII